MLNSRDGKDGVSPSSGIPPSRYEETKKELGVSFGGGQPNVAVKPKAQNSDSSFGNN
jgi:hypothetical protein